MANLYSVIIPTYNGAKFIGDTMNAVLAQTLMPDKIIVVDDASTDDTCTLVGAIARKSSIPVETITLATNSGSPSIPTNVGIRHADSHFIGVVDQDDTILPHKFEREVGILQQNTALSVACSCCADGKSAEVRLQSSDVLDEINRLGNQCNGYVDLTGPLFLELLLKHGCFPIGFPGFTFRRSAALSAGGVDEGLRIADHDFLCKLALQGNVAFLLEIGYHRRYHDSNLSGDRLKVGVDFVEVIDRYLGLLDPSAQRRCFERVGGSLTGLAYMLETAGDFQGALRCGRIIGSTWGWNKRLAMRQVRISFQRLIKPYMKSKTSKDAKKNNLFLFM